MSSTKMTTIFGGLALPPGRAALLPRGKASSPTTAQRAIRTTAILIMTKLREAKSVAAANSARQSCAPASYYGLQGHRRSTAVVRIATWSRVRVEFGRPERKGEFHDRDGNAGDLRSRCLHRSLLGGPLPEDDRGRHPHVRGQGRVTRKLRDPQNAAHPTARWNH